MLPVIRRGARAIPEVFAGAITTLVVAMLVALLVGCGGGEPKAAAPTRVDGEAVAVRDTTLATTFEAAGVAAPLRQATLATKVMGTVRAVLVHEGDVVAAGQPLVRIDDRDLTARAGQTAASVREAEAVRRDAAAQAQRIRALYADSVATRAQLDAVETALARAEAGVRASRAAAAEVGAVSSYAVVRAPFAGVVTRRFVDPGAFAAPGTPLVTVQDASRLRIAASVAPDAVRGVRRGQPIAATIEGDAVRATVEGIVPGAAGNLYTVNALVPNPRARMLAGSVAVLLLPLGAHRALVIPARAVTRDGDLTGVTLRAPAGDQLRWVRLGEEAGGVVEVTAGLRAGDLVVVPAKGTERVATFGAMGSPFRRGRR